MSTRADTQSTEEWREIPNYNGHYEVSNFGRVRSWKDRHGGRSAEPCYIKPRVNKQGYIRYQLGGARPFKFCFAHRLVLMVFVGESSLDVNHKNGVKDDNRLSNLEYVTKSENSRHARDVLARTWGRKGKDNHAARLTPEQVAEIRALSSEGASDKELAVRFDVSRQHISKIRRGDRWGATSDVSDLLASEAMKLIEGIAKKMAVANAEVAGAA